MPMSTDTGLLTGQPVNDAYGTLTAAANTEFMRTIPPRENERAKIAGFIYDCSTTAHTLTAMTVIAEVSVTSEAATGQAVINISSSPTGADGGIIAASDFCVVQYEDGTWDTLKVSSVSGLAITMTANLSKKVLSGSRFFFMGAPGDHSSRQFTALASKVLTVLGADSRMCVATAAKDDQPLVFHSNNATAQGYLQWLSYVYGDA